MNDTLVCWRCGASLADQPVPLGRLAECKSCGAQLHVCRLCQFYDVSAAKSCREPVADEVTNKDRANFCGYFQAKPGAYVAPDDSKAKAARATLSDLFGGASNAPTPTAADEARRALDQLFGPIISRGGKKQE